MSLLEIQQALTSLTDKERSLLHEHLYALEEGVSVEEWRAMNAALQEEFDNPSPLIPAAEVFARFKARFRQNEA